MLSATDCARLGVFHEQPEGYLATVISHDCDCAAGIDVEANIEVILATISKQLIPNNMHAKNPRLLQLASKESGLSLDLDLRVRASLSKRTLASIEPDTTIRFSRDERRILARWLASRYDRGFLPDELQKRLLAVEDTIEKASKAHPTSILGVYVYHDRDEELSDEELYVLDIRVVYDSEDPTAKEAATKAANTIDTRFKRKFYTGDNGIRPVWVGVELEHCSAMSDAEFSLFDAMAYTLWRLEYVSLRQEPMADTPTFR